MTLIPLLEWIVCAIMKSVQPSALPQMGLDN
jgi:hypothetical protein